jgi:hypothetical protein
MIRTGPGVSHKEVASFCETHGKNPDPFEPCRRGHFPNRFAFSLAIPGKRKILTASGSGKEKEPIKRRLN